MKVRIAHVSDNHFSEHHRLDDCVRVHRAFVEEAFKLGVEVALLAGDFFDARSTPAERNALADWLSYLSAAGITVYGVAGNHDVPGDLDIFNHVIGEPGHILDRELGTNTPELMGHERGISVVGLPWVERAMLIDGGLDTLLNEIAELGYAERRAGRVPVLLAHLEMQGYVGSAGYEVAGATLAIPPGHDAFSPYAYVALGHVHGRQGWADGRIAYSGAPRRLNFGEVDERGWSLVDVDLEAPEGTPPEVTFKPLADRRTTVLSAGAGDVDAAIAAGGIGEGDLVRLRIDCRSGDDVHLDLAEIERKIRALGALEAKVELVIDRDVRVRSVEIVSATTTWEQLLAYFNSTGGRDEERLVSLRELLGRIEREVR